jgi:hypothetical protein
MAMAMASKQGHASGAANKRRQITNRKWVCFRVFSAILRLFPRHVINLAGYLMVSALSRDFRDVVPRVIKLNKVWSQIGPNDTPRICQRVA